MGEGSKTNKCGIEEPINDFKEEKYMSRTTLRGRDFITWLDFTHEEIEGILETAHDLKRKQIRGEPHKLLDAKTLFMLFYNSSLRTRNSFETGMTQLGGHANFLQPGAVYTPVVKGKDIPYTTERVKDVAQVLSEMGDGIAIRIYGEPTDWIYGKGNELIQEFARWATIPVINMEDDMYHPCQALADIMTMQEKLGDLRKKKFVMSWAYSGSVKKPLAVPQSAIISASYFGMDIVLAHPKGLELDSDVLSAVEKNVRRYGGSFKVGYDMDEAFRNADVVYPKSWAAKTPVSNVIDLERAKEIFEANKDWICTQEKMELTNDAIYMHCLPANRGMEVSEDVIDGPNSVVVEEAGNRLHAQKGLMATIMAS